MDPKLSFIVDGKKFMWDGTVYASESDATAAAASYQTDNFEVTTVCNEGRYLVYTRRVAGQVPAAQ